VNAVIRVCTVTAEIITVP